MKSVIPFSKELDFSTKLSEITSISLERDFSLEKNSIEGNLYVSGDYKSHEVSANVLPFSYKIPFSIEIPENLNPDSITLEISDFAYDITSDTQIKVNIELELEGDVEEKQEEIIETPVEVDTEEILKMMEEERDDSIEHTEETCEEEIVENSLEEEEIIQEEEVKEEVLNILEDKIEDTTTSDENRTGSEDVILENVTGEDEFATYHIHIVKDGESVETICTMYNSNLSMLSEYNDLSSIQMGEKIIIPCSDES